MSCGWYEAETTEVTTTTEPALVDVKTLVLLWALLVKETKPLVATVDGVTTATDASVVRPADAATTSMVDVTVGVLDWRF